MKIEHGANLYELSSQLNRDTKEFLDFSSNINPYGASQKAKENVIKNIDMVSIYPDPEYKNLKRSISHYCRVGEENIILGSGATELISSFIKVVKPKKTMLLSPAYSEYERELVKIESSISKIYYEMENNFQINILELIKRVGAEKPDLIIICNPNNPTGTSLKCSEIEELLKFYKGIIMIDETYIEFTDEKIYSAIPLIEKYNNIFIIRGTSKFFSTPGIRLGYGILGTGKLYEEMNSLANLWNINIFATLMGEVMFRDEEYIQLSKEKIENSLEKLRIELKKFVELKTYETTSNFILCEIIAKNLTAEKLREELLKEGIIIRDAAKFPGLTEKFFRICVLKEEENLKLIEILKKYLK